MAQQHSNRYRSPIPNKRLERMTREDKEKALIDRDRDKKDKLDRQYSSPISAPPLLPAEENIKNAHWIGDKVDVKPVPENVTKKLDFVTSSPVELLERSCEIRNTAKTSNVIGQTPPSSTIKIYNDTHVVTNLDLLSISSNVDITSGGP